MTCYGYPPLEITEVDRAPDIRTVAYKRQSKRGTDFFVNTGDKEAMKNNERNDENEGEIIISLNEKIDDLGTGGLPFISDTSENRVSKGIEIPDDYISLDEQVKVLFAIPGGGIW